MRPLALLLIFFAPTVLAVCGTCAAGAAGAQGGSPYVLSLYCGQPGSTISALGSISWGDDVTGVCRPAPLNASDPCDNGGDATRIRDLLAALCVGKPLCLVNVSTDALGPFCLPKQSVAKSFALTVEATCGAGPAFSTCGGLGGPALSFAGVFTNNAVLQRGPARAALYGSVPPGAFSPGATVSVSLQSAAGGAPVTASGAVAPDGSWKAVLPQGMEPSGGGNYTVTAACASGCAALPFMRPAQIVNVTLGDVWMCSGQSNTQLPMSFTFALNASIAALKAGNYSNVRYYQIEYAPWDAAPQWVLPAYEAQGLGYVWSRAGDLVGQVDSRGFPADALRGAYATCWYFAQALTDQMAAAGAVVPIGVLASAQGGTMIESWAPASAQGACADIGCLCPTPRCNHSQPFDPAVCTGNGELFNSMVAPFVNMSLFGHIWYQGENNMGGTQGNVAQGTGYACLLKQMITSWRALWSVEPGTTAPLSPFGVATMHYGSAEGAPQNVALSNWAHTGNFGTLPSPDLPNTFLAQNTDIGDPWDAPECGGAQGCCVAKWLPLGPTCWGDFRGQWDQTSTPGLMGGIHCRTKFEMGKRFAHAAWNSPSAYGKGASPASGPVVSGCALAGSLLTLKFNATLLRGAPLIVRPNTANASNYNQSQTSHTFVLAGGDLDPACALGQQMNKNGYTAFQGGNECFQGTPPKPGWVSVEIAAGSAPNEVVIDLSKYPLLSGTNITAIRHNWGYAPCCGVRQGTWPGWVSEPCPPYSCPLVVDVPSAGGTEVLPAVGFLARVDAASGKCKCMAPQVCDE